MLSMGCKPRSRVVRSVAVVLDDWMGNTKPMWLRWYVQCLLLGGNTGVCGGFLIA